MAEIKKFIADKNLAPKKNLNALVSYARYDLSEIFQVNPKDWPNNVWIIGKCRAGHHIRLKWTDIDTTVHKASRPLTQLFGDFARAYVVIEQSLAAVKRQYHKIYALRLLERAQIELQGRADVISLNASVFDYALVIAKKKYKNLYQIGNQLCHITRFLNEYHLTKAFISWNHGEKFAYKNSYASGKEGKKYEQEQLPPIAAFNALPPLIQIAEKQDAALYDVGPIYFLMLLACAPARAGEICYNLRVDCLFAQDGLLYLRWWPEKGAPPVSKRVNSKMVDEVHKIVKKLTMHTDEGRRIAKWYEKNPTSIYLPSHLEHLREQELLTTKQVMQITGKKDRRQINRPLKSVGLEPARKKGRYNLYSFDALEKALLKKYPLPAGFPYLNAEMGLKYSDALMVSQKYAMKVGYNSLPFFFEGINYPMIRESLNSASTTQNIFSRNEFFNEDGSHIRVKTHSVRHLIDSIASYLGVSDEVRAREAGRKDVGQNKAYEHLTADDLINMAKEKGLVGPIKEFAVNAPISFEKYISLCIPNAHPTEYGVCVHDWTQRPCQRFGDHLNCREQLYIKGFFPEKEQLLRRTLSESERMLANTIEAKGEGIFVQDRWDEYHSMTVKRLKGLINILDDPSVPDGAIIQLSANQEFSLIGRAIQKRRQLLDKGGDILKIVHQIKESAKSSNELDTTKYKPELLRPYLELIDESELS